MRQSAIFVSIVLSALPAFALDEKPLLAQGGMEFGFRFGGDATYQLLDGSWNTTDAATPGVPLAWSSEATFKYGMSDRSDLEIVLPWVYRDKDYATLEGRADGYGGFDRAHLAAKIRLTKSVESGLTFGFSFPLGHEKVVGFNPEWGFTLGTYGGYRKGIWSADALATWSTTPKSSSGFQPGDVTLLTARTGVQLDEGVAPNFGLSYSYVDKSVLGKSTGIPLTGMVAVSKIVATPGCVLLLDEEWSLDVRVPVVVAGANTHAAAGLSVGIVGYFEP